MKTSKENERMIAFKKVRKAVKNMKWMRCIMIAAAAVMLGGCAMGGATGEKTVLGIQYLEDEDYQQAQKMFEEAILEGEQDTLAYRGLGIAQMGMAQYEEAAASFEQALDAADERMPENVLDISLYLATAQYRMKEYEETADTCTRILEKSEQGDAQAYFLRGASCLYEDMPEEAEEDFARAIALAPDDYDLYLNIYECYSDNDLSGVGGEYLQSALNIQGDDLEHYYNRGRIYYYLGNYEEAQSQLIGPVEAGYEPAMFLIARVYMAQEDYERAEAVYLQIQQESGESAQIFNGLALCAMERGNYDFALGYITQGLALEGASGKQELYFNEIVLYERKLDFEKARIKAQEYVERYPADEKGIRELTFLKTR